MADRAGRRPPYWVAQRLIGVGLGSWSYLNGAARWEAGVDLREMELDDFCDMVHWFMIRNMDDQTRVQWELRLDMPPPSVPMDEIPADNAWSVESEMESFNAAMAAFGSISKEE